MMTMTGRTSYSLAINLGTPQHPWMSPRQFGHALYHHEMAEDAQLPFQLWLSHESDRKQHQE